MVKRGGGRGGGGKFSKQAGRGRKRGKRETALASPPAPGRKRKAKRFDKATLPHDDSEEELTVDFSLVGEEEGEEEDALEIFDDAKPKLAKVAASKAPKPSRFSHAFTDVLSQEVDRFISTVTATSAEDEEEVSNVLQQVRTCAESLWSESSTVLFGSRATGLSLPCGDIDIGILNVSRDMVNAGAGFKRKDRDRISTLLKRLLNKLRKCKLVKKAQVVRARVPIIKCELCRSGLACDISMGVSNGERALGLIRENMAKYPKTFASLVLVVKGILQSWGLGEVYLGGLGSYSLYNMVLAHLLTEKQQQQQQQGSSKDREDKDNDLTIGYLLVSFLKRFGLTFDYVKEAVSINNGGFIGKRREWVDVKNRFLIAIEDPQDPGRDIGKASHNISKVQRKFRACYEILEKQQAHSERERRSGGNPIHPNPSAGLWPQLGRIMKVDLVLKKASPPSTFSNGNHHHNNTKSHHHTPASMEGRLGGRLRGRDANRGKRARSTTANNTNTNSSRQVFFQKKRRVEQNASPDFDDDLFRIPTRNSNSNTRKGKAKARATANAKIAKAAKAASPKGTRGGGKRAKLQRALSDVVDDGDLSGGSVTKKKKTKKQLRKAREMELKRMDEFLKKKAKGKKQQW